MASIFKIILERIRNFFVLVREGYRFKDKMIILEYYLKSPIHLFNHLIGKRNSLTLRGNVFVKNKYGIFYCGNNFSRVFGASSICEPNVRKELNLKEGIAMDVGANCGMHTIPLAKMLGKNGRVISVEPEKDNAGLLRKNVKLNNLKNVLVVEKGCFSKKGETTFYLDELGTGGHSLLKDSSLKKEIIHVDTIDNILKRLKINKINLMKIDVEGVEMEVLKGAKKTLKKSHPKIVFEAWNKKKMKEIENFLSKEDYKVKRIDDWNYVAV